MKINKLQLFLAIFTLVCPMTILAISSPPPIPLLVYGNVTIDDQPASVNTEISAEIDNVEVAVAIMIGEGIYFIEIPDGKANEGKIIKFKVDGIISDNQLLSVNIDTIPSVNFDLIVTTTATTTTRSCSISNGQGIQTWDGSDWGNCILESCNSGYHQESNSCIVDSTSGGGGGSSYTPPTTPPSTTQGDINGDNKVDKYDFALMMANWGKIGSNDSDLNGDNKVDKYDFALLMVNWGT